MTHLDISWRFLCGDSFTIFLTDLYWPRTNSLPGAWAVHQNLTAGFSGKLGQETGIGSDFQQLGTTWTATEMQNLWHAIRLAKNAWNPHEWKDDRWFWTVCSGFSNGHFSGVRCFRTVHIFHCKKAAIELVVALGISGNVFILHSFNECSCDSSRVPFIIPKSWCWWLLISSHSRHYWLSAVWSQYRSHWNPKLWETEKLIVAPSPMAPTAVCRCSSCRCSKCSSNLDVRGTHCDLWCPYLSYLICITRMYLHDIYLISIRCLYDMLVCIDVNCMLTNVLYLERCKLHSFWTTW